MNWLALIVFVFGIIWLAKGQRAAFSFLPGMFVFLVGEMLIWSFLKPNTYPGDFFDIFLPVITIPIGVVLSIPLLFAARYVARKRYAVIERHKGPKKLLPLLSASRLPGLLAVILAAGIVWLGARLDEQSLADLKKSEDAKEQIIRDFFIGKTGAEELEEIFGMQPYLCRKTYSKQIDVLLEKNPEQAALFLRAMTQKCKIWTEASTDFVASREENGGIKALDTLLGIGLLDDGTIRGKILSILFKNHNNDQLLRIFAHYHAQALSTHSSQASSALEQIISMARNDREFLMRVLAFAGNDPALYLTEFDIDIVNYNLLSYAADTLDTDLMRAGLALGFTKEITRFGSVLVHFVQFHGGSTVIRKLLEKGVKVNALNQYGETALGCLLSVSSPEALMLSREEEEKTAEIMDLLSTLWKPEHYLTSEGDTPLHFACRAAKQSPHAIEEIKVLMAWGADPNLAGKDTVPPLELARQKGWDDLIPVLTRE